MGDEDMSSNYSQVFRKIMFLYISRVFFILNHAKCLLLANSIEHSLLNGLSTVHELLPVASCFPSHFLFPTVPSLSRSALFAGPVLTQCGLVCWCHLLWHLLPSSMLWLISNSQHSYAYFNRRACLGSKIQLRAYKYTSHHLSTVSSHLWGNKTKSNRAVIAYPCLPWHVGGEPRRSPSLQPSVQSSTHFALLFPQEKNMRYEFRGCEVTKQSANVSWPPQKKTFGVP